jgi:hypothetical protein
VKQHREGIEELPPDPRTKARLKIDNSFAVNKVSKNIAPTNPEASPAAATTRHHHVWKSPRSSFLTLLGAIRYPVSFW